VDAICRRATGCPAGVLSGPIFHQRARRVVHPFFIFGQLEQRAAGKVFVLGAVRISERFEKAERNQGPDGDRLEIKERGGTPNTDATGQASQVQENQGVMVEHLRNAGGV